MKREEKINFLREQTAKYAIEYITRKGEHQKFSWFRDSFNELCEAIGANEFDPKEIGFDLEDLNNALKKELWVTDIARKPKHDISSADIDRIVDDFILKYWTYWRKESVTSKDVADVLKVADPLSHRHIVANRVAIDCIHALTHDELYDLDGILKDLEREPNLERPKRNNKEN